MSRRMTGKNLVTLVVLLILAGIPTSALAYFHTASNNSLNSKAISQSTSATGPNTQLGFDCGLGTTAAVLNATSFPVAPSENGVPEIVPGCTWIGDVALTIPGAATDGTTEPLVTDQDESLGTVSTAIGGGFTVDMVYLQNATSATNGFDIQINWNPKVLQLVKFDQTGLPWLTQSPFTEQSTIDNSIGQLHVVQVIFVHLGGDVVFFRLRFDVVGVGNTGLTISNDVITNPGAVIHTTFNGAFDSETFFDPTHALSWVASFTNSTPIVPGATNQFTATVSGGTGPYTYAWDFSSHGITDSTTNPANIVIPTATLTGNRIKLTVTDSALHVITLVRELPLIVAVQGPPQMTTSVGTANTFTGDWLGGIPPYTGSWRFCPGALPTLPSVDCSTPAPAIASQPGQTNVRAVTYTRAGVYTDTLKITDTASPVFPSTVNTLTLTFLVTVTGTPQAYTLTLSANPTSATVGQQVTYTVVAAYSAGYTLSLRSSTIGVVVQFGDGTSAPATITFATGGANSTSVAHTYLKGSGPAGFTVVAVGKETATNAVSTIQESSNQLTEVISSRSTTTGVVCTPASVNVGAASNCVATVTDNAVGTSSTPLGTVSFASSGAGNFLPITCPLSEVTPGLSSSCSANYTPTAAGSGSHVVTATYSGDLTHSTSQGTATVTVTSPLDATSTTVSCSPSSITTVQTSSCTATVTDTTTPSNIPSGTVTFTLTAGTTGGSLSSLTCLLSATGSCSVTFQGATAAGTATVSASYGGDITHGISASTVSAMITVTVATVTIGTTLSQTTITVGGSVADSAALSGNTATAGGTVTYRFFSGTACSGTGTIVGSPVTVTAGVVPNSASQSFNTAGSFSWNAAYSGDASNSPATSACEPLTVNQASPTIATTLAAGSITVGGSVTDSATITSGFQAGGTVTYNFFTGSTCSGSATPVGSPVTVTGGVVPNSASQTFNSAGAFSWNAVYSGDTNNKGTTSACEPLTVTKASPTISTTLSSTTISAGGSVSDSATLTSGFQASGTVTYSFFTGSTCSGTGTVVGTPVTVTGGVVPGSASQSFPNAGSFSWNAVYSGDGNNNGSPSACEPLTVNPAGGAVLATSLSATSIAVGGSVTDSATLTGVTANAGGTVTYSFFTGSTCAGTGTVVGSPVTVTAGVVPNSASQAFNSAGSFSWNAVYSGDANNGGTTSGCEPLTVNKASPTVATSLASSQITVGGSVTDSATLTGGFQAGGTVTYNFFTGSTCGGTATPVGAPVTVTGGVVPNSAAQAFNSAGSFSWNAVYSGDSNNNGASSTCEPLTVGKASPSIATTLSASSINQGSSVTDSASLTNGFQAGGTVTYSFFTGSTCGGTGTVVGTPVTVTNGVVPNSASQTFATAGSFSWNALYSGDANNNGATSSCEPLTVNVVSVVTISTTLSSNSITVGGSITDSATLSQVTATAGGTVTYSFFTGSTCSGTGTVVGAPVTVTNGVVPNSASQAFNTAGSYSWNAVYSGDANNVGATSACEPLTVSQAAPTITTSLSASAISAGGSVIDSATMTGGFQAGGTVTYNFFTGGTCGGTATVVGTPVTVTNGVIPNSASQTFSNPGTFSWNAVYSGDTNNKGTTSACELFIVNPVIHAVSVTTSLNPNPVVVGGSVTDSATLTGNTATAGGTVTYNFFTGSACAGTGTVVGSPVTVTNGIVPNSASQSFNTVGSFSWNAVYSGDPSNSGATSACEPLTVNMASPTITTTLSSSSITVGQSVTDSATLSNSFNAGGIVSYKLFGNGVCSGTATPIANVTVTTGVVPNSPSRQFNTTGTFGWEAVYFGDSNNNGATSACEPLTVSSVISQPFLLTFQAFNFSAFHNGIGPLTVFVNGHVVADFPGHGFVSSSSTVVFGNDHWVTLGPFDITQFVIQGQNNVTFANTFGIRFSLIRNIMVTQGDTTFLNFKGPRFVFSGHPLTLTFSNPPLVITSFTVSSTTPVVGQNLTFTATYTGGTAPFTCKFRFGDDSSTTVPGTAGTCSVSHIYQDSENVTARVTITGSSTSDKVTASLKISIADPTTISLPATILSLDEPTTDDD